MSMRLFEIAVVEKTSAIELARKIIDLYNCDNLSVAEYNWLVRKSEDEYAKHILNKAISRRSFNYMKVDEIDDYLLDDASTLCRAVNILREIEKMTHLKAETAIKQSTDEFLNSEELKQLAQQQAYVDLQNSYAEDYADSSKHVSKLAQRASKI